jgi:hypothetical protein
MSNNIADRIMYFFANTYAGHSQKKKSHYVTGRLYIYVVPLETLWHRQPHGSGSPQSQNTDICLAFFWTGFHYSDSKQYSGDPCCEKRKSFH